MTFFHVRVQTSLRSVRRHFIENFNVGALCALDAVKGEVVLLYTSKGCSQAVFIL